MPTYPPLGNEQGIDETLERESRPHDSLGRGGKLPHRTSESGHRIERADSCLYAAKHNGRNRVICAVDPEFLVLAERRVA